MLRNRMITFTGMVLVLTVGVVCALLYRQVFLPIKHLANFTDRADSANLEEHFPEVTGEIARLAKAFHGMARRLRELEHEHFHHHVKERPPEPPDASRQNP
jgi:nitrate/nitrite-specific signal transduction histidine kinase